MRFILFFLCLTLALLVPVFYALSNFPSWIFQSVEIPLAISMILAGFVTRIAFDRHFQT